MDKTILIAGKEFPFCDAFVNYAVANRYNVMVTLSQTGENPRKPEPPVAEFIWNRSSPISARSLVLQTENTFKSLDCAFLIFDTASYVTDFERMSAETLSRGMDTLFAGYIYLCSELLDRFQKRGGGILCFILEKHPKLVDLAKSNAMPPAGPLVAAAEAAFKSFAENISARESANPMNIHLIECPSGIDEKVTLVPWLYSYLEKAAISPTMGVKNIARWVTPGTKFSSGRPFFGR